jgi:hypothetical protein
MYSTWLENGQSIVYPVVMPIRHSITAQPAAMGDTGCRRS